MIKSILVSTALLMASASVTAAEKDLATLYHEICTLQTTRAEVAITARYNINDISDPRINKIMTKYPTMRPMMVAAFKQRYVPSSIFNDDREVAIKRFKNSWYSTCINEMESKYAS